MRNLIEDLPEDLRKKLKCIRQPEWTKPMLATLVDEPFSDPDWNFERKFDGERMLVFRYGRKVQLLSRNRKSLNATYPELRDAIADQESDDFIVDGEVVAFDGNVTSFSRLQNRMQLKNETKARRSGIAVFFYVFDLLHLEGNDITRLPLRDRKRLLKGALNFSDPLRFSAHRNEHGEKYYEEACRKGWEGLIAKDARSAYLHGRSRKWLKFKCVNRQEFVIGGFTDPQGSRIGFGALMLGYYEDDKLRYAGMVGTGYSDDLLEQLTDRMKKMERDDAPFLLDDLPKQSVHWIQPELVDEVGFTEWTKAGKLRHPRFLGLRRDKNPRDVVREN